MPRIGAHYSVYRLRSERGREVKFWPKEGGGQRTILRFHIPRGTPGYYEFYVADHYAHSGYFIVAGPFDTLESAEESHRGF